MQKNFEIPKVVAFIDNGEFDNISEITKDLVDDAYCPYLDYGIAYDDYIICLCCGSVIPLTDCIFCKEIGEVGTFVFNDYVDVNCTAKYEYDDDGCLKDIVIE